MSTHMYGRHGPGAWRKWHERRYEQPPSPRIAVVFLRVPPTIERVIVVLMSENEYIDDLDPQTTAGSGVATTTVPSHIVDARGANGSIREKLDPLRQVGSTAYIKGTRQGTIDRERQNILSAEELDDEAAKLSSEYADSPNNPAVEYEAVLVLEEFETQYKAGYFRGSKVKSAEELPSTWKRVIQRRAHRERDQDERKGDARTGDPLLGLAIESALGAVGIHSKERKQVVKEHISIYLEAYEHYTPQDRHEQERDSFRHGRSL